jgi:hypothetical protein
MTSNGKQTRVLGHSKNESEMVNKFRMLTLNSELVSFPTRYVNSNGIKKSDFEIFLIKKKTSKKDNAIIPLRDYYGSITEFKTDNDDWVILNRENYEIEESFWVYGFDKVKDRKDYKWILNNIIYKDNNINNIKRIIVFQNKLLIESQEKMDMVLCKNKSDCIRLYNSIQTDVLKDKMGKTIFFMGDGFNSSLKKSWYEKMEKLTGWTRRKLNRNSLKP